MGVLEFDNVLGKVFFLKDENKIVLQVDGKYDYCNLTLTKEEFDELLETIPSLIESAGYYSVEVSETDENVVCLNLVKIIKLLRIQFFFVSLHRLSEREQSPKRLVLCTNK